MLKLFGGFACLKVNDWRTQLSRKDKLARKRRQTNRMLIQGRLEDLLQLNNFMKPDSPALKKKTKGKLSSPS